MNVPSLQRLTVLSIIFHVTFFCAVFFAIKQSSRFVMPSPYVVDLVDAEVKTEKAGSTQTVSRPAEQETHKVLPKKEVSKKKEAIPFSPKESGKTSEREEQRRVEEKIAALEAIKRTKEIVKLRSIVSAKSGAAGGKGSKGSKATHSHGVSGAVGGLTISDYGAIIASEIHRHYETPPNLAGKDLVAIVTIRMAKDGFVQSCRIKESSGNILFDRSVLSAVNKASPLTPPPDAEKMEVEVRFSQ
jgi:colicin import membrane protein